MATDEINAKLQKLKTLSERGSPGERDNAKMLFEKLCKKYHISIKDVVISDEKEIRWFKYKGGSLFRQLLLQCTYKTMGVGWDKATYRRGKSRCLVGVECTAAQGIEIEMDYSFYSNHLKNEMQRVVDMFIQRNSIFPPNSPVSKGSMSEEDLQLACSMKKHIRTLQVGDGK